MLAPSELAKAVLETRLIAEEPPKGAIEKLRAVEVNERLSKVVRAQLLLLTTRECAYERRRRLAATRAAA